MPLESPSFESILRNRVYFLGNEGQGGRRFARQFDFLCVQVYLIGRPGVQNRHLGQKWGLSLMDKIVVSMRTLGTAVTLAFAAATLPAQQPAPDSPGKTAEQAYKNIQV